VVELDPSLMWTRLFNHPKMHDWQVCPWDGLADPISIEENFTFSYEVSGFGAAVYKPVGRDYRNINFNDSMSLEKFFHNWQQPSNIFNIYNKDILDKSIEKLVSRSKALLDEGEKAENLSARLFLDGRGPLWGGILSKNVLKRVRLYPFLDHRVLSNGFSQRQEDRGSYRFHFEVMNICNAGLARMPFLDDQWPSNLSQYGANISPPFKTHFKPTSINMVPQKWSFLHSESDNIKDFILSSRNSPLFDIVNYNNALPAIERLFSESNVVYAKSIFNLIYFKLVLEGLQNDSCHFLKSKDKFIIKSNNKDLEFCFRNGYLSGQASYYYSSAEGKSEKVNFEIPVNTKKVRLDPMKEKGVFVIRRLFYIIDGLEKDISINDIKLKNMNLVGSNNNSYTLVATSDDPQLIFNAVNEVCPSSLTCYINLKRKSKLELFYDSGHGFNEGEKLIRCIN
ncbi:hypothetical protein P0F04_003066, partial [Vibrio metschnikovii]|nr:hypothetical protein [Vibrio metschnikovii]